MAEGDRNEEQEKLIVKITLTSTTKLITLLVNGVDVPARIWQGETESGIEVHAYVTRIAVHKDLDYSQFERELVSCAEPTPDTEAIPLRLIL